MTSKASWQECFSAGMPGRQAGKGTFCRRNHPWGSFSLQRDAFRGRKASLGELFLAEGCLGGRDFSDMLFSGLLAAAELSGEIIPAGAFHCRGMHFAQKESIPERAFSCRGMHFAEGNHPWKSFFLLRDALPHRIVIPDRVSS